MNEFENLTVTRRRLAVSTGMALLGFSQEGIGEAPKSTQLKRQESVYIGDFGCIGDDSDETQRLKTAISASAGKSLFFDSGKTYRTTDEILVYEHTKIDLCGSKLKLEIRGEKKCLDMRSYSEIINGKIELCGSDYAGSGDKGAPIVIGDYGTGVGYKNIIIENVEITSNRPNGNGIIVTGNSSNIRLKNITFPDSETIGRPILIHWGGADAPTAGTTHPFNIHIENIDCGTLTNSSLDTGVVLISAAYNVNVTNIHIQDCRLYAVVYMFAGDYGSFYAANGIKGLINTNIKYTNVAVVSATRSLVKIDCRSTLDPGRAVLNGPMIENLVGVTSSTTMPAVIVSNCIQAEIKNAKIAGGIVGLSTGENVKHLRITGGSYKKSQYSCLRIANGKNPPEDCIIEGVEACNAGLGGGKHAGISLGAQKRTICQGNILGASSGETTAYGIHVMDGEGLVLTNNHCKAALISAFYVASSTGSKTLKEFHGNSAAPGIILKSGEVLELQPGDPRL